MVASTLARPLARHKAAHLSRQLVPYPYTNIGGWSGAPELHPLIYASWNFGETSRISDTGGLIDSITEPINSLTLSGSGANRPTTGSSTTDGGKNAALFNSSDQTWLRTASETLLSGDFTYGLYFRANPLQTGSDYQIFADSYDGSDRIQVRQGEIGGLKSMQMVSPTNVNWANNLVTADTWHRVICSRNGTSGLMATMFDTTFWPEGTWGTPGTNPWGLITMGSSFNGASRNLDGEIAGFFLFNGLLTEAEMALLDAWMVSYYETAAGPSGDAYSIPGGGGSYQPPGGSDYYVQPGS